jgi:mannose-6-phosphate isomerase
MERCIYPLIFVPVLRDYIWGGRRLETLYGRRIPPGHTAESWEISGHPAGPTAAESGYWAGRPLPEIQEQLGPALVGERGAWALQRRRFPLLVKLLDAQQDLSVQVHPDDAYAQAHEDGELGKTEMWYVLHAEPGSEIILGLPPGIQREQFAAALEAGRLDSVLRRVPVAAGQAVAVPAGTVHALLAGIVVTEIQQTSDATYRVFDWNRLGPEGQPRPLHVAKALDVIDFAGQGTRQGRATPSIAVPKMLSGAQGARQAELVRNAYFVVEEIKLEEGDAFEGLCDGATLEIWGCVRGAARIEWESQPVPLPSIRYALLPATLGAYRIRGQEQSTCLRVYLPKG